MRILHLGFEDFRRPGSGGGAVRTHEINRRLAQRHDVTVVTTSWLGAEDRVEDGVRYIHVGLPRGYFPSLLSYFACLPGVVRKHEADLVVEDFAAPFSSALTPLYVRKPLVAMVQWLNAREKSKQYKLPFFLFEKFGVPRYESFIAVSEDLGSKIRSMNKSAKIDVVANGVDREAFDASSDQKRDLVFLGRLEREQKGLDLLLRAYAKVAPHISEDLILAGDGNDEAALRRLAHDYGIGDRVQFVGRVEGKAKFDLLASARIVVMPSRFETFGIVAGEALATGSPVLAFEIPCLRAVVPPSVGRLVRPFDVDAFGVAIRDMLHDEGELAAMGRAGREFAKQFDWDALALQQEAIYEAAIAAQGSKK